MQDEQWKKKDEILGDGPDKEGRKHNGVSVTCLNSICTQMQKDKIEGITYERKCNAMGSPLNWLEKLYGGKRGLGVTRFL